METAKHISHSLLLLLPLAAAACSGDEKDDATGGAMGGTSSEMPGGNGGSVNAGSGSGGSANGGSANGGTGTGGSATGGSGTGGSATGGSGTGGSGTGFTETGVCGQRGTGTVNATTFEVVEEFYLKADEGFGDDICVVQFPVKRLGDAPGGCEDCLWSHQVGYEMPTVLLDVDGVCASSELGMDSERLAQIMGSTPSYGYIFEFSGHNSVLVKFQETTQTWQPNGNANWDPDTDAFRFNNLNGTCAY